MDRPALLALEDGSLFPGVSIGAIGQTVGEVVFNTAMTGYQEILTDPSYTRQIVTFTYPHIGNVGTNADDAESSQVWAAGLIIRDSPKQDSSWRNQMSLNAYLEKHQIVGIAEIDTRRLTRILREKGALNGCIIAGVVDETVARKLAQNFSGLNGLDLAKEVTTAKAYRWDTGSWSAPSATVPTSVEKQFHVVAYDYGIKRNILRRLADSGCWVTVVPAQTSANDVLALKPDGIVFSNGPGGPAACDYAIAAIKELLPAKIPLFGICLGHQLLALACGAKTFKMKFGHHGANHPVQDLATKQVMISSQNHGFAVDETSLPAELKPSHRSLFDGTLQGLQHAHFPAFSFQGHPEAGPGPDDVKPLFDRFVNLMADYQRLIVETARAV